MLNLVPPKGWSNLRRFEEGWKKPRKVKGNKIEIFTMLSQVIPSDPSKFALTFPYIISNKSCALSVREERKRTDKD